MGWSRRACVLQNGSFSWLYGFWASIGVGRGKFELPKYYLEKALSLIWRPPPSSGLACADGPQKDAQPQEGGWAVLHSTSLDLIPRAWVPAGMFPADCGWTPGTWGIISFKRCWYSRAWEGRCYHFCFANEKTDLLGLSDSFKVMVVEPEPKSSSSNKCCWLNRPLLPRVMAFSSSALPSNSSCKLSMAIPA